MKIYSFQKSEGLNELLGYLCDSCATYVAGEDLPSDFIEEQYKHYCLECQFTCVGCLENFSIDYVKSWFKDDLCENCHDTFKELKS